MLRPDEASQQYLALVHMRRLPIGRARLPCYSLF